MGYKAMKLSASRVYLSPALALLRKAHVLRVFRLLGQAFSSVPLIGYSQSRHSRNGTVCEAHSDAVRSQQPLPFRE